ncbi:hypothetical protein RND81_01G020300 [Saponaria officinalis]|uniref:RING-type E3 ubiquitin transferase n=1 Tax=Saponaria officinalis TaxID=3572 RepID=A0AAW1N5L7_SAPOF
MDADSETNQQELSYRELLDQNNNGFGSDDLNRFPGCGLCGRSLSLEDEVNGGHQNVSVCNDCKFLLLEDFGSPARNSNRRRLPGRSRSIYGSSDLTENRFSQQFSQIINLARHVEPGHEGFFDDADSNSMLLQPSSSHTTPNGSVRWRRIISESESDVSNSDSYYGESESNISYGAYYHGDSDALSMSTYEGDSDTSVGGRTFFNTDVVQSVDRSDFDTDSDIDPMHVGNVRWDFDDHEEVEDAEWEEVINEENAVEPLQVIPHMNTGGGSGSFLRPRRADSSESLEIIRWRISEVELHAPYIGDPGDYLDAQGFEEFLEHIAETDSSRRGAPPASKSFVANLPLILICEEHQKPDGLACAICKDFLTVGTEVNQLPCLHLYHPICILPWLSTRNTCPLCRYELPADEIEYEPSRRIASRRIMITEINQQDDNSSIMTDSSEMDELDGELEDVASAADISWSNRRRGGWFLFAAAPIVSLMGIVFVLWLGNPLAGGRGHLNCRPSDLIQTSTSCPRTERSRRWWWF